MVERFMTGPPAPNWLVYKDAQGRPYYHNAVTGQTTYEHFMDIETRQAIAEARAAKGGASKKK